MLHWAAYTWLCFYQTRSAWSVDQGSNKNHSPAYNFAPTVTKFCVMWEGLSLPHDTKFGNCRCTIVDSRAFLSWSLIHGLRWSGLIKAEPGTVVHILFLHWGTWKHVSVYYLLSWPAMKLWKAYILRRFLMGIISIVSPWVGWLGTPSGSIGSSLAKNWNWTSLWRLMGVKVNVILNNRSTVCSNAYPC